MLSSTDRFAILTRFLGMGNQAAAIWFIGLEEAGQWGKDPHKDEEQLRRYALGHFALERGEILEAREKNGRTYTKVYDVMAKAVAALVHGPENIQSRWLDEVARLLTEDGQTFHANLLPLGKPRRHGEWPAPYKELSGFASQQEYEAAIRPERCRLLHAEWERRRPRITVCFGKEAWHCFRDIVGVESQNGECLGQSEVHADRGIALTPFFRSSLMPDRAIAELAEPLRRHLPD